MSRVVLAAVVVLAASCCPEACAQTTAADHTFERAGSPRIVARWARPSRLPTHQPGYVGGAAVLGGEGPAGPSDGVFGYDYVGYGPADRVFLGWLHSHTAPPSGPYRTDTHRVFDVFSLRPVRKALANEREGHR